MSKKLLRIVFSSVLSLFVAILLLATGLSHYALTSICAPNILLSQVEHGAYTNELYDEIQYDWENLVSIAGIQQPETVMDVLTPHRVKQDTLLYIESAYTGSSVLNVDALRTELTVAIRAYVNTQDVDPSQEAELEQNIKDLVDACIADYRSAVAVPLLPKLLGAAGSLTELLELVMLVLPVALLLLLLFIFFLQAKRQDLLYYLSIAVASCGILLTGITHMANYNMVIQRLPFEESAMKTLVSDYLGALLVRLQQYGYLYLIVAAALVLIYVLIGIISWMLQKSKATGHTNETM